MSAKEKGLYKAESFSLRRRKKSEEGGRETVFYDAKEEGENRNSFPGASSSLSQSTK